VVEGNIAAGINGRYRQFNHLLRKKDLKCTHICGSVLAQGKPVKLAGVTREKLAQNLVPLALSHCLTRLLCLL
jgi:hypothetical protein